MIQPVILSGGGGTRLWPLSRQSFPKPYWCLTGENSLFQETLLRVNNSHLFKKPIILCNNDHRFLVLDQIQEVGIEPSEIILETELRNTAAAIAIACLTQDPNSLLLILPSDHVIQDVESFYTVIETAEKIAVNDKIVTFGICPNKAETSYGYIKIGHPITKEKSAFLVEAFIEKPDLPTAEKFVQTEDYLWNSGIFLFKAKTMLNELQRLHPDLVEQAKLAFKNSKKDLNFVRLDSSAISKQNNLSIDYAVMERTPYIAVVPANMRWFDLGSWDSIWDMSADKNKDGNVLIGDVVTEGVQNSYVRSEQQLISVLGLDNIIAIATSDAILIANQSCAPQIQEIIQKLKNNNRKELNIHNRVYRPWGYYQCIDKGNRFQVKRLMIKPGEKTSIQIHYHRSEHWVVVEGTAKVTRGNEILLIHENESVYLAKGMQHRIENPGKLPLHIIEVQSGSYLEEDDIVRIEDVYGRMEESVV